jgi:hypothetical protein
VILVSGSSDRGNKKCKNNFGGKTWWKAIFWKTKKEIER